ncbi:MAG TPA: GPMC system family 4 glycosyltransferase [Desulfuromonadaceae bacterium]|jgi:glycosyltransferase involved in cell wall biosynthesis
MRVAIIAPYSIGPMRGNITTVRRIARFLGLAGVEVKILASDAMPILEMESCISSFSPDIIHGFHVRHCGLTACNLAARHGIPAVITITGTDINDPQLRSNPATAHAMAAAAAVVCFDEFVAENVAGYFPNAASRLSIVPQGIEPLSVKYEHSFDIPENAFVLLLPAALRPVKNVEFAIQTLAALAIDNDWLQLVIAGGVIDPGYAAAIQKMLADKPFARWLGEVPYQQMGDLYARADLVLNCSLFEGMPNSLLEAMALGRPVLARDIPGNHSLIQEGETGWLYRDEEDFRRQVLRLADDAALREQTGRRAREYVLSNFSPELETERYLKLYKSLG